MYTAEDLTRELYHIDGLALGSGTVSNSKSIGSVPWQPVKMLENPQERSSQLASALLMTL